MPGIETRTITFIYFYSYLVKVKVKMEELNGCQMVNLPKIAEGISPIQVNSPFQLFKYTLTKPWNYTVKGSLKKIDRWFSGLKKRVNYPSGKDLIEHTPEISPLSSGDLVRVKDRSEIERSLDRWGELKGCAFLEGMWQYCGTTQKVFKPLNAFWMRETTALRNRGGLFCLMVFFAMALQFLDHATGVAFYFGARNG